MNEETARQSVDFMFAESGEQRRVHLTFFGGETLLNFKVLQKTLAYAQERAAELGKSVDVSLTTNAHAAARRDHRLDGGERRRRHRVDRRRRKEQQDGFRVFTNGMGSYDVIAARRSRSCWRGTTAARSARGSRSRGRTSTS